MGINIGGKKVDNSQAQAVAAEAQAAATSNGDTVSSSDPLLFSSTSDVSAVPVEWETVKPTLSKRCASILISGPPDTGRTCLALTSPGPIAYIDLSEKSGVIHDFADETEIRRMFISCVFRGSAEQVQAAASREADKVEAAIYDAYKWARTIIIDTKDALYDTVQYARFGTLVRAEKSEDDRKLGRLAYQAVKIRFRSMLIGKFRELSEQRNVNLILVGKMTEQYDGNKATGKFVDSNLQSIYDIDLVLHCKRAGMLFTATYSKPWIASDKRDKAVRGGQLDIPYILSDLTNTPIDEWR